LPVLFNTVLELYFHPAYSWWNVNSHDI